MHRTIEELKERYIEEAVMAYQVCRLLDQKLMTYSLTTVKAISRFLDFDFDREATNFGKHSWSLGRIVEYIQCYDIENDLPDRTRIILRQDGKVAFSEEDARDLTGEQLIELFKFPWKDHPLPSIVGMEKAYAIHHPTSAAAHKHRSMRVA